MMALVHNIFSWYPAFSMKYLSGYPPGTSIYEKLQEPSSYNADESDALLICKGKPLHPDLINAEVIVAQDHLWNEFHLHTNEMIVTPKGRRLHPKLSLQIRGINPQQYYYLIVEFNPVDSHRYKYVYSKSQWEIVGDADPTPPSRAHYHHSAPVGSPLIGELWMNKWVEFDKLKLSNQVDNSCEAHIILNPMQKYQPVVSLIVADESYASIVYCNVKMFSFPETQFIAVTAYNNTRVKELKINTNPYAKGFRKQNYGRNKSVNNMKKYVSACPLIKWDLCSPHLDWSFKVYDNEYSTRVTRRADDSMDDSIASDQLEDGENHKPGLYSGSGILGVTGKAFSDCMHSTGSCLLDTTYQDGCHDSEDYNLRLWSSQAFIKL